MNEVLIIPDERAGLELDEFLCLRFPHWSKGFIRHQVRNGGVLLDGMPAHPSKRLRTNQVVMLDIDEEALPTTPPDPGIELSVLHEEEQWLVVDKPSGLPVEPDRWCRDGNSLRDALSAQAPHSEAEDDRLRIVHRLDKETSGALLLAKTVEAERWLRKGFDEGEIHKVYLALVEGEHPLADGEHEVIEAPIGADQRRTGRMMVRERGGKPSRTRISVERRFKGLTLLRCEPLTGKTHQIRVHLAHCGFPLAVDSTYGRRDALFLSTLKAGYRAKRGRPERPLIDRLTLHALELGVTPPGSTGPILVQAPWPRDIQIVVKQLTKHRNWQT